MLVSQGTMQPRAICALADVSLNMLSDAVVRMKEYYAALAQSLKDRNSTSFWKDVEKLESSKIPLATKVGGAIGDEQISEMWHHHSLDLLNSVHNTDSKVLFLSTLMTPFLKQQFLFPSVMYVAF